MQTNEISQIISQLEAGAVFNIEMMRPAKVRKNVTDVLQKHSVFQGQNRHYAEHSEVRAGVESGVRDEPELPGHIARSFELDGVRFWEGKNGETYLPVLLAEDGEKSVTWYRNGVAVDKEDIVEFLLAAESPKPKDNSEKGQVPFVGINISNILSVSPQD